MRYPSAIILASWFGIRADFEYILETVVISEEAQWE